MDGTDHLLSTLQDSSSAGVSISVAMATYNGEAYLQEQLDSLALQELMPFELVVTDDASSDRTLLVLQEFAKIAPFEVRVYQNPNRLGFADNFLKCVSLCRGRIIAFCDQDDKWHPEKLRICIKEFDDPGVLLCVHSATIWRSGTKLSRRAPDFKIRSVHNPNSTDPLTVYAGYSMVFKKTLLDFCDVFRRPRDIHSVPGRDVLMSHDRLIWFVASILGKIVCLPNDLVFYRLHPQNTCGITPDRGLMQKLLLTAKTVNYEVLSDFSNECARFLEESLETTQLNHNEIRHYCEVAAKRFRTRARLLKLRAALYNRDANLATRLILIVKITVEGGYLFNPYGHRLGLRAALKDVLYGLPGIPRIRSLGIDT